VTVIDGFHDAVESVAVPEPANATTDVVIATGGVPAG
jgi:hypothetical protein